MTSHARAGHVPKRSPKDYGDRVRPGWVLALGATAAIALALIVAIAVGWMRNGQAAHAATRRPSAADPSDGVGAKPPPPAVVASLPARGTPSPESPSLASAPAPSSAASDAGAGADAAAVDFIADADEQLARAAAACVTRRDRAIDAQYIGVLYMLEIRGGVAHARDLSVSDSTLDEALEACVVEKMTAAQWPATGAGDVIMKRSFSRRVVDFAPRR